MRKRAPKSFGCCLIGVKPLLQKSLVELTHEVLERFCRAGRHDDEQDETGGRAGGRADGRFCCISFVFDGEEKRRGILSSLGVFSLQVGRGASGGVGVAGVELVFFVVW